MAQPCSSQNLCISYTITAACPSSFNANCPQKRPYFCPKDNITYTRAYTSSSIVLMGWTGSGFTCIPQASGFPANSIILAQAAGYSPNPVVESCGNLSAVMTNVSGTCYTSVLTIRTPQYYNGTTVLCRDLLTGVVIGSNTSNIQTDTPRACK